MAQTKTAAPSTRLEPELARRLLTQMQLIRRFEEKAAEMYALGKIGGFLHLYIGQEAVAVGAISTLRPDDYAHRLLPRAWPLPREGLGSPTGHGRALRPPGRPQQGQGRLHAPLRQERQFPRRARDRRRPPALAAGAAFAVKYQGGDQVVQCYFGDGAVPEGEFHEAMNLAALWKLPVIFICENNRYAMGTAIHRALARTEIWRFAEHYGMYAEAVDGMDVLAIRDVVARAVERARRDKAPALIEARTYRFRGHSMRDPAGAVYRTREEVERERQRDPIALFTDRCMRDGVLTEADLAAIEKAINDTVDEAVAFAEASPEPPAEWLLTDVYKD